MTTDTDVQPTEGLPLVLEYIPFSHQLVATNRLSEDEYGASQVAADHVTRWFGLWAESAWRRESDPTLQEQPYQRIFRTPVRFADCPPTCRGHDESSHWDEAERP